MLYVLVAPRIVAHRHVDLSDLEGASRSLASHLERYHSSDRWPVDDWQLHFHLSFSLLPGEISAGTGVESGPLPAADVASELRDAVSAGDPLAEPPISLHLASTAQAASSRELPHHGSVLFRRLTLCVWNI